MSWVTVIWSMIASACLTLAVIYFLSWIRNRAAWAHLFFSLTAASTTTFAFCELSMMRALTPDELVAAMKWAHVALFFWLVSTVGFVRLYLGAGRLWLAWTISGMRLLYLFLLLASPNVNYREITTLRRVEFLGEPVTVLTGVPHPVTLFGQFAVLLILIFVADASVSVWRRGDRRKALIVGGSVEFFLLTGLGTSVAVIWANLQMPIVFSVLYLGLVAVMAYELSRDVLRASTLVHELQVSEAELRESEARLNLAVEAGEFGIWIWDFGRNDVWASESWRALFRFAPNEPLAINDVLRRVHPDDRAALQQTQTMAIAGANGGRYRTEHRLLLPDGETRWIASRGRREVDPAGRAIRMRGVSRDVTARKQTEQEVQALQQEIAHAARVSMMGQLASGLAHEINQPLAAILRNAEAAEMYLQRPSPDLAEIRAILTDIRTDDERAGHVIDRMRGLLKRHTLDTRRLDVGSLVADVAALLRVDAAAREVKLDVAVPRDLPPVRGDRVHIQQVLLNLVLNGMDALNGARLEDRSVSMIARVNAASGAPIVEIGVDDAGPGIPPARLAQIFDPFFSTKPNGMGMGLAISRTIVEAHGGRIWAENKAGSGAAFRFTLPIADEATRNEGD
jgi:two-component system, LuxR family, sensor kinase FixL